MWQWNHCSQKAGDNLKHVKWLLKKIRQKKCGSFFGGGRSIHDAFKNIFVGYSFYDTYTCRSKVFTYLLRSILGLVYLGHTCTCLSVHTLLLYTVNPWIRAVPWKRACLEPLLGRGASGRFEKNVTCRVSIINLIRASAWALQRYTVHNISESGFALLVNINVNFVSDRSRAQHLLAASMAAYCREAFFGKIDLT